MDNRDCLTCRWYRALTAKPTDGGVCRRSAPTLDAGDGRYRGWPRVEPGDYCGEYAARVETTEAMEQARQFAERARRISGRDWKSGRLARARQSDTGGQAKPAAPLRPMDQRGQASTTDWGITTMASLLKKPNGTRRMQFVGPDKPANRQTDRFVSKLLADTSKHWLYDRLAAAGLVEARDIPEEIEAAKLGNFITAYIEGRTDLEEGTVVALKHVRQRLVEYFGVARSLDLDSSETLLASHGRGLRTSGQSTDRRGAVQSAANRDRLP